MAAKKPKTAAKKKAAGRTPPRSKAATLTAFRLNIEVGDLAKAADFYGKLLGLEGSLRPGSRCYFRSGSMTLQIVDVSSLGPPHPLPKCLYFATDDLEVV